MARVSHTPTSFLAQNYPTPCRDPFYQEKPYLPMTLGTFRVPGLLVLDLPKKYCGANPFLFRIYFVIYDLVLWVFFFFLVSKQKLIKQGLLKLWIEPYLTFQWGRDRPLHCPASSQGAGPHLFPPRQKVEATLAGAAHHSKQTPGICCRLSGQVCAQYISLSTLHVGHRPGQNTWEGDRYLRGPLSQNVKHGICSKMKYIKLFNKWQLILYWRQQ